MFPRDSSPGVVEKAIVIAGTCEIFFDACKVFGKNPMNALSVRVDKEISVDSFGNSKFVFAAAVDEVHVQPVLDSLIGYNDGRAMRAIIAFLENL